MVSSSSSLSWRSSRHLASLERLLVLDFSTECARRGYTPPTAVSISSMDLLGRIGSAIRIVAIYSSKRVLEDEAHRHLLDNDTRCNEEFSSYSGECKGREKAVEDGKMGEGEGEEKKRSEWLTDI
jgi:hypothetical protein